MKNGTTDLATRPTLPALVAGGWVTDIRVAQDRTMIVRTDTSNAFVLDPGGTEWKPQLLFGKNIGVEHQNIFIFGNAERSGAGIYDADLCWSNSAARVIASNFVLYGTKDAGVTYTKLNLAAIDGMYPNQDSRMCGRPLGIDPFNENVIVFAAPNGGVRISTDFGQNWTTISTSTIPAPTSGYRSIVGFDRASASGGRCQIIWIFVPGSGLWKTSNAGSTWSKVLDAPSDPTLAADLKVHPTNGRVAIAGDGMQGGGRVRVFNPGTNTWVQSPMNTKNVVFSPYVAGTIYSIDIGGGMNMSRDNGANWDIQDTNSARPQYHADKAKYLEQYYGEPIPVHGYLGIGNVEFDPVENKLWCSHGTGVAVSESPLPTTKASDGASHWYDRSFGIENMVMTTGEFNSVGDAGVAMHDKQVMILKAAEIGKKFPETHGINFSQAIRHAATISSSPTNPLFWGTSVFVHGHGYTEDGGKTWTRKTTLAESFGRQYSNDTAGAGGGHFICLDDNIHVCIETNDSKYLAITFDKQNTWTRIDVATATYGSLAYYLNPRRLIRDAYTPYRFYFYNAPTDQPVDAGVYRFDVNPVTKAVTKTKVFTGYVMVNGADFYDFKFTQVGPNDFIACGGHVNAGMKRSTDGMATWTDIAGGTDNKGTGTVWGEVFSVGVGKAPTGSTVKPLLVDGYRLESKRNSTQADNAKRGIWLSLDNGVTWTFITYYFGCHMAVAADIIGDPTRYGRWLILGPGMGLYVWDRKYEALAV